MKQRHLAAALCIVVAVFGLSTVALHRAHIDIDSQSIAGALGRQFPMERCLVSACMRLTDPQVDLSAAAGRAAFSAVVEAEFLDHHVRERVVLNGVPRYDRDSGNFYLDAAAVGTASGQAFGVGSSFLAAPLGSLTARALQNLPIFNVDQLPWTAAWARRFIANASLHDGKVRLTFETP